MTKLTWDRRDSTPLSYAPRAPKITKEGINYWGYDYKTQHSYPRSRLNHLKKARGEIWPKRSEEETAQKQLRWEQKVRNKEKINSLIKKPHLKMIPIKDNLFTV